MNNGLTSLRKNSKYNRLLFVYRRIIINNLDDIQRLYERARETRESKASLSNRILRHLNRRHIQVRRVGRAKQIKVEVIQPDWKGYIEQ